MTRGVLVVTGLVLMLAAATDRVRVHAAQPEKDAVYAFGHWFDVLWEIDMPLFVGGAVLAVVGLRHR